jgi:hypothetical protein
MSDQRVFCGKDDPEAVIVERVFPASPIVVSSGIHLHKEKNGIAIQGPNEHLKFAFPYLTELLRIRRDSDKTGQWIGIDWFNKEWLSIYYEFGQSFWDAFELLECKFRRDVGFFCNLKLARKAVLKVVNKGQLVLNIDSLGLPEGLKKNGEIEFPEIPTLVQPENLIN